VEAVGNNKPDLYASQYPYHLGRLLAETSSTIRGVILREVGEKQGKKGIFFGGTFLVEKKTMSLKVRLCQDWGPNVCLQWCWPTTTLHLALVVAQTKHEFCHRGAA